ncbi:hypothetical protein EDC04DRAFT_2600622 [Pisolithus marmoratus]|nr:hypothetical protein EDC04DRAFT_2600622 [Pisolithus marmoratus]
MWQRPGKVVQPRPTDSQVQDRWMNQAYWSPPSETISLEISALHKGSPRKGHMHGTPFGCICEGMKDIDACATVPELVTTALAKLTPKISEFCPQFLWRPSEFVIHDSSWVNLSSVPDPMQPYFYHDCLHPSTRKNSKTLVFRPKQFLLFIVVPESQWQEYKDFKQAMSATDTGCSISVCHPNPPSRPATPPATASSFNTSAAQRPLLHDLALTSDERSTSMSSTTHSPPSKKMVGMSGCDQVKEALQVGGAANIDIGRGK